MKHTPYTANLSSEAERPPDWRAQGACTKVDPEIFFPSRSGNAKAARRVCAACPVKAECLEWALTHPRPTEFGIWGGTSERQRRVLRAQAKGNSTNRGYAGQTRTPVPAEPFRTALFALIPKSFPSRRGLATFVSEHSDLRRRSVSDFLERQTRTVILEWALLVCAALGRPDLPAQLWPTEAAA